MKIQTLQKTARRLGKKLGVYVAVCVEFNVYDVGRDDLRYSFYVENESHHTEKTAQGLNTAMNNRIKREDAVDEGIEDELP